MNFPTLLHMILLLISKITIVNIHRSPPLTHATSWSPPVDMSSKYGAYRAHLTAVGPLVRPISGRYFNRNI